MTYIWDCSSCAYYIPHYEEFKPSYVYRCKGSDKLHCFEQEFNKKIHGFKGIWKIDMGFNHAKEVLSKL